MIHLMQVEGGWQWYGEGKIYATRAEALAMASWVMANGAEPAEENDA